MTLMEWISVRERMPEVGDRVLICYERKNYSNNISRMYTIAVYVDGLVPEDLLPYDFSNLFDKMKYDEANDRYLAPKGWYEELSSINSEYFCILSDRENVTHWMPLSELPEVNDED